MGYKKEVKNVSADCWSLYEDNTRFRPEDVPRAADRVDRVQYDLRVERRKTQSHRHDIGVTVFERSALNGEPVVINYSLKVLDESTAKSLRDWLIEAYPLGDDQ